jgi:hypothetical protein
MMQGVPDSLDHLTEQGILALRMEADLLRGIEGCLEAVGADAGVDYS